MQSCRLTVEQDVQLRHRWGRGVVWWGGAISLLIPFSVAHSESATTPHATSDGLIEWTIESRKAYVDPFNDVDVDVVFTRNGHSWRVPTFWKGGQKWMVRFGPPAAGVYEYKIESTDKGNADLNGRSGHVTIASYSGDNQLFMHGPIRVSTSRRYFEHADGIPFYWLGDTWWDALSDRLSWDGFQRLVADRKKKGFTVVQLAAGLVPEEKCPADPGCQNEGGAVWDADFKRINPIFFDYADRRIEGLVNAGIAPAIVGAWYTALQDVGVEKLKKHWRYIIARYGAYPVFWLVGGEVCDPPISVLRELGIPAQQNSGGWSEVARYIRKTDPYHHPVTVHEVSPDLPPLQEEALTDFRLFQPAHFGWPSIAVEIGLLNSHFSRTAVTKPLVVGEIGFEGLGGMHWQDFQRMAFWGAMLNGAAGFTYGATGTWESYTADKRFQLNKWSLLTWEEGMNLPGSSQVGLGSKLLRRLQWWKFEPHPEWVTPRGTTLLEPRGGLNDFHLNLQSEWGDFAGTGVDLKPSDWRKRNGNFGLPYAAGAPRKVRVIYIPYFGLIPPTPPTLLGLEPDVRYQSYYWEPSLGVKVDLGHLDRRVQGAMVLKGGFDGRTTWTDYGHKMARSREALSTRGATVSVIDGINEPDVVVSAIIDAGSDGGFLIRFRDKANFMAAIYSKQSREIYLREQKNGRPGRMLGRTPVTISADKLRLTAEMRGQIGAVSLNDGIRTFTSPIEDIASAEGGGIGFTCECPGSGQHFRELEIRKSQAPRKEAHLERKLFDAEGTYRGQLAGTGDGSLASINWETYGNEKKVLLDAYRPEALPFSGDWLLVLQACDSSPDGAFPAECVKSKEESTLVTINHN